MNCKARIYYNGMRCVIFNYIIFLKADYKIFCPSNYMLNVKSSFAELSMTANGVEFWVKKLFYYFKCTSSTRMIHFKQVFLSARHHHHLAGPPIPLSSKNQKYFFGECTTTTTTTTKKFSGKVLQRLVVEDPSSVVTSEPSSSSSFMQKGYFKNISFGHSHSLQISYGKNTSSRMGCPVLLSPI